MMRDKSSHSPGNSISSFGNDALWQILKQRTHLHVDEAVLPCLPERGGSAQGTQKTRLWTYLNDTGQASISMATPRSGTLRFTPSVVLSPGDYNASLALANQLGAQSTELILFSVAQAVQYRAEFVSPDEGAVVLNPLVRVVLEATSNATHAGQVQIDGVDADVESYAEPRRYYRDLELRPGPNLVRAVVVFEDGTQRKFTRTLNFDDVPIVTIDEPADFSILGAIGPNQPGGASNLTGQVERPVTIVGRISRPAEQVLINQQEATLDAARTGFRFERYFLREGTNLISATALNRMTVPISQQNGLSRSNLIAINKGSLCLRFDQ